MTSSASHESPESMAVVARGAGKPFAPSPGFIRRPAVASCMPMKSSGPGSLTEIDRWDGGAGWIAHAEEEMQRASHALVSDGEVWVVDPVDVDGLDEWLAELGEVAGVVVLLDRHKRDSAAVARRHDVAVHVPRWMSGVATKLDAPVERTDDTLGDTGYEVHRIIDNPFWQEAALYNPESRVLVTPEAFGTVEYYCAPEEDLGVHPALRLFPPKKLERFDADRLLVGHGEGVPEGASRAIRDALDGARRNAPGLYAKTLRDALP